MKYFQNGGTSGNTGNRRYFYFFKWKSLILTSHFDSTLNFEFGASFCQHLSVIVLDLCHFFCKKARLQDFINKFITLEPLEINNCFFCLVEFLKTVFSAISENFFMIHTPTEIFQNC
jgi:sulfate adenylyltransferase subunit 1 (EFTu-like GTPase family)